MNLLSKIKIFLTLLTVAGTGTAFGADCSQRIFPGYIVGRGEGGSYEEAKAAALVDMISFFGVHVDSTAEVEETGDGSSGASLTTSIKSTVKKVVKGAEVLATCHAEAATTVIVGQKRAALRSLLEQQAKDRDQLIDASREIKKSTAKALLEDEKADREAWTLLQFPSGEFPVLPAQAMRKLIAASSASGKTYHIRADGPLAETTIAAAIQRLEKEGIAVQRSNTASIAWACSTATGSAIGTNVRFTARCGFSGDEIAVEKVEVSGIAAVSEVEATAARLVEEKLITPN